MLLTGVGGVSFSEGALANTEEGWRQKPPASTGRNFKIPFAYRSVFSIPVKKGEALYEVLLIRVGDAEQPLGSGWATGAVSCWGGTHFMQREPCPGGLPGSAFSGDTRGHGRQERLP